MNKNDILKYALIGGGAYALYWYVTNYGPQGSVNNAAGQKVLPSYWDTWFGTTATTTSSGAASGAGSGGGSGTLTPAQQLAAAQAACVSPNIWNNSTATCGPPVQVNKDPGTVANKFSTYSALREAILQAAGIPDTVATQGYMMSADQWNYYQNNVNTTLSAQQFGQVIASLPAGASRASLSIDQFIAALKASGVLSGLSGLGDVVPSYSVPSIPMMSFGGNAFSSPFGSPMGPGKGWRN